MQFTLKPTGRTITSFQVLAPRKRAQALHNATIALASVRRTADELHCRGRDARPCAKKTRAKQGEM